MVSPECVFQLCVAFLFCSINDNRFIKSLVVPLFGLLNISLKVSIPRSECSEFSIKRERSVFYILQLSLGKILL